ncbi:hypothetical protein RND81_07G150000 [Saponaria officinalis]|uniref:Nudix hydrolase domain-containing protein n=1 Tax=Saponaria officinalis TaxID=3572 RepID=A0AAW1JNJ1_SAPOF
MDAKNATETVTLSQVAAQLRLVNRSVRRNAGSSSDSQAGSRGVAAVLVCIFQGDAGDLRVILTQRSSSLSSHPALPGGKMENGDKDEVETALREAKEEIGLDQSLVDVVCTLDSFTMKNGMVVVPVIGLLHNKAAYRPTLNAAEVEAIFDAPLDMFLKDENRREVVKEWMGETYLLHYFDYEFEGKIYVIFALSAGILIQTASTVFRRPPDFIEMKPKFWNSTTST